MGSEAYIARWHVDLVGHQVNLRIGGRCRRKDRHAIFWLVEKIVVASASD